MISSIAAAVATSMPPLAYAWGWGWAWWWWWVAIIIIFWAIFWAPFGVRGRRIYGRRDIAGYAPVATTRAVDDLTPAEAEAIAARERATQAWRTVESRFFDSPPAAVIEADRLVSAMMRERGYGAASEPAAVNGAVDVPSEQNVPNGFRAAHDVALRAERGDATTDELRLAMVSYRSLFERLLSLPPTVRGSDDLGASTTTERSARR